MLRYKNLILAISSFSFLFGCSNKYRLDLKNKSGKRIESLEINLCNEKYYFDSIDDEGEVVIIFKGFCKKEGGIDFYSVKNNQPLGSCLYFDDNKDYQVELVIKKLPVSGFDCKVK